MDENTIWAVFWICLFSFLIVIMGMSWISSLYTTRLNHIRRLEEIKRRGENE